MQRQWEYMILLPDESSKVKYQEDELNQLGAQGWELVAALSTIERPNWLGGSSTSQIQYILKRLKP